MILIKKNRLSRAEISSIKKTVAELSKAIKDTQTIPSVEKGPEEPKGILEAPAATKETSASNHLLKQKVLTLVAQYRKDINEEDLPKVQTELMDFFDSQPRQPYYLLMDRRYEKEDKRLVIIGDTHCDYNSLAALFDKLSLSAYDYFDNATFIFLGDYLDRGNILFEYLMLLVGFKKLLGNRCIFLKGNHELIEYNEVLGELESMVHPADTCPTLNSYCGTNKEFLAKFADYFANLPYYILLKTTKGTDLLVHGGIPRDAIMEKCTISHDTGEMLVAGDDRIRGIALDNMIWADPRSDRFKLQGGGSRFEFGYEQFDQFVIANKIDRIFRSHEPVQNGVEAFYNNRLYTVFSNGGAKNPVTGYPEVENPVVAIMGVDGEVRFESLYFKKVTINKGYSVLNTVLYMEEDASAGFSLELEDLHLNNEFYIVNQ
jgi:hypothetical protein